MADHDTIDHTGITGAGGSVATDTIWDAAGDLAVGSGANTAAKLTKGSALQVLRVNAAATNLEYATLTTVSGELDYVAFTSAVNVSQTTEGAADTIVTANAEAFDGSTVAIIEFFAPRSRPAASANATLDFCLYDGASSIGLLGRQHSAAASSATFAVYLMHRLTPSNASHTYSIHAFVSTGTGVVTGGAGGSGAIMPGFIRISLA